MGMKCAIWRNGHLGNCNLAPATVVKELRTVPVWFDLVLMAKINSVTVAIP